MRKIITPKKISILPILMSNLLISNCSSDLSVDANADSKNQTVSGINLTDLAYEELSSEEVDKLKFLREEEKLARDVYNAFYTKWSTEVFNNISQSEQRHTDAIEVLLEKYNSIVNSN